jgi:hypothetical protein
MQSLAIGAALRDRPVPVLAETYVRVKAAVRQSLHEGLP